MSNYIELSIIIPTINEEENLGKLIKGIRDEVAKITPQYEIVIVDGGSKDRTVEIAKSSGAKVIFQSIAGYGVATREGFKNADGKYLLTMDADLSHNPDFIYKMWEARDNAELVIASRYVPGGRTEMPFLRYMLSLILNKVFREVLLIPVYDFSSGFRLYRTDIVKDLNLISCNFDVLEEILVKLYFKGYKVKEIPFTYIPRKLGKSKVRFLKFTISFLKTLYKMWKLRNSVNR